MSGTKSVPSIAVNKPLLLVLALAAVSVAPTDAHACGGCFAPPNPTGTVSVVNAHRMAFLSSPTESVLWDQVQYTGDPADFAWVLPVVGNPTVEVADNGFFEALTVATTITMVGPLPPSNFCPDPCAPWSDSVGFASASRSAASDAGVFNPVNVLHEGVVGPYETATIMSADPMALVDWLHAHGYQVPAEIEPTIAYYVGIGMNFVALRLAPQAGIDRMQPVRIRAPGLSLMLPLRMIAAGVGSNVDLELFVLAESRMETATFPNAEVDRTAIAYDWANGTFDYDAQFEAALFSGEGVQTNWVTEFAQEPSVYQLSSYRSGEGATAHSAEEDMAIVTDALPTPYLTRLRTRLTPNELDTDLTLRTTSARDIAPRFNVTRERHRAPDRVCDQVCDTADGIEPGASSERGTGRSYRCGASAGDGSSGVLAAIGIVAFWLARRRAR